jgi:hypothetical protein
MPATPPTTPAAGPTPRLRRELIIYGIALACGLILMPFLIWSIGSRVLGPYIHGDNPHAGPFALFGDFWVGLVHGSAVFWIVAVGPALVILLVRIFLVVLRVLPSPGRDRRA